MTAKVQALQLWFRAFALAAIFSIAGIKVFAAWPQVSDLWDAEASLILLIGHPHFFRFLATYPGFVLESHFPGTGFSLYVALFFAFNCTLWDRLSRRVNGDGPSWIPWIVFLGAHVAMNGRGVIAWTAWLLAAGACLDMSANHIRLAVALGKSITALFFAAVSTGVFVVVFSVIAFFGVKRIRQGWLGLEGWGFFTTLVLGIPLLNLAIEYFFAALDKNLSYYGGGWSGAVNMLEHGLGMLVTNGGVAGLLMVLALLPMLLVMAFVWLVGKPASPIMILMVAALLGGIFGFTVLTLAIPMVLLNIGTRSPAVKV